MNSSAGVVPTAQDRLQARLADPDTIDSLNRLLDRVDLMAFMLEAVDGFLRRSDTVVESVSEGVREVRQSAAVADAAPLFETLPKLARSGAELAEAAASPAFTNVLQSGLLERLGDPRTLRLLDTLFDKLETAVFLLEAVDGFLRRSDEIAESASAIVGELRGARVDLDEVKQLAARTPRVVEALGRLTESQTLDRVPDLVNTVTVLAESGMLDPALVKLLSELGHRLGRAYSDAASKPVQPLGAVGAFRALGEPEVQRALGLLVAVARRFGRDVH